jgi:hypothetical protein
MPLVFIHGVNTRDTDPDYFIEKEARRKQFDDVVAVNMRKPPLAVWVRFATLKTWERADTLEGVSVGTGLIDGVPFLMVRAVKESPLILQVGYPGAPVTNVLLPSRLMHVSNVRVLLPGGRGQPEADCGTESRLGRSGGTVRDGRQRSCRQTGTGG